MPNQTKTNGILLKKTWLANDDAILDFFTWDYGKISIFARKLGRSKKRLPEIDFFRFLELEIFEGRNNKTLKSVSTVSIFSGFSGSFSAVETGLGWCEKIRNILPEEKPLESLFSKITKIFGQFQPENLEKFDAFFRTKLLQFNGVLPRFDQIRSDVYFCPRNFHFSGNNLPNSIRIQNTSRQILEFLRRSDTEAFVQKISRLPAENFPEAALVLGKIEEFYY